jgi:hypothetical protein
MSDERGLTAGDRSSYPEGADRMSDDRRLTRGGTAIRLIAAIAVLGAGIVALVVAILLVRGVLA